MADHQTGIIVQEPQNIYHIGVDQMQRNFDGMRKQLLAAHFGQMADIRRSNDRQVTVTRAAAPSATFANDHHEEEDSTFAPAAQPAHPPAIDLLTQLHRSG